METIMDRNEIKVEDYWEIFDAEPHDHKIIKDSSGVLRWKEDKRVNSLVDKMGLNELMELLYRLGYTKNSEVIRKLYRNMGYSLSGYWEVFYWDANNPDASEYKYQPD